MIPPTLSCLYFSIPETNETLEDSPTKFFGSVRQKSFDGKSWYSPLPSYPNFFATGNFLKHNTEYFTYGFSVPRDKTILTENRDSRPPSLFFNIFRYSKLMKHKRIPLRNFSSLWDKKIWTENLDNLPPSPLLSINFFATGNFLKHSTESFPYEVFRSRETKQCRRKIVISVHPLLFINFFATGSFLKHSTERFPCEVFRYCETTKNFDRISWHNPREHKIFRCPKFCETQKGSPTKFFGPARQNNFDGKSWFTPTLSYL